MIHPLVPLNGVLGHALSLEVVRQLFRNDREDILESLSSGSLVALGGSVLRAGLAGRHVEELRWMCECQQAIPEARTKSRLPRAMVERSKRVGGGERFFRNLPGRRRSGTKAHGDMHMQ